MGGSRWREIMEKTCGCEYKATPRATVISLDQWTLMLDGLHQHLDLNPNEFPDMQTHIT